MPIKRFVDIYRRFEKRTNGLVNEFEDKISIVDDYGELFEKIHNDARSFILIRLQMLWGQFCRELIIRSALGGYHTVSGTVLKKGTSVNDWKSVQVAVQKRSNYGNPSWHIANFSIDIAKNLRIQNYGEVSMALGGISPMDYVIVVRNYVVHPDEKTRTKYENTLRAMGIMVKIAPVSLLRSRVAGGANLFEQWVNELQTLAVNAIR